ncbi:MAG: porin, partial [Pseudomonadota bacterium]|nr:porin [Pseudomonadota bacterium]
NNAVGYKNNFGMASLWITYSPDETDVGDSNGVTDGQGDDGQYTAALKVSQDNWEAFVSMVDNGNSDATAEYDSTKVGGQYNMGPHTISAQYEMSSQGTGANTDTDTMFLGYQMKMGKNTFVAQIGQTDEDGVSEKEDYMAIGAIHKLNKKARVFVGYRDTDQGAVSEESSFSVGLRVDI